MSTVLLSNPPAAGRIVFVVPINGKGAS